MDDRQRRALGALAHVRVGEAGQHLQRDVQRGARGQLAAAQLGAAHDRAQVGAAHVLHHDEQRLIRFDQVEGVDDVRVVERRGDLGFPEKQVAELRARGVLGQQLLEHDLLLEPARPELLADVDRPHAAFGQVALDPVAARRGQLVGGGGHQQVEGRIAKHKFQ
jgi:hypothetical protein